MFKTLTKNPEIHSILQNFSPDYWEKALEGLCVYGARKLTSQSLPITTKTIEEILKPSDGLQKTLRFMKHEIKHLSSAIKRIERKTHSSTDLIKEFKLAHKENPSLHKTEDKSRHSSSKNSVTKPSVKVCERSYTPTYLTLKKEIKEPKVCPLNDAQKIINSINAPKMALLGKIESVVVNSELLKSKISSSTFDTSPRFSMKDSPRNFTFRK